LTRSKNEWSYTSIPQYAFMAWCSVKATIPCNRALEVSTYIAKEDKMKYMKKIY